METSSLPADYRYPMSPLPPVDPFACKAMGGHVEWHDYPGEFPMTEATIALLANMAGRPPIE